MDLSTLIVVSFVSSRDWFTTVRDSAIGPPQARGSVKSGRVTLGPAQPRVDFSRGCSCGDVGVVVPLLFMRDVRERAILTAACPVHFPIVDVSEMCYY